jgi:hypothetical protein
LPSIDPSTLNTASANRWCCAARGAAEGTAHQFAVLTRGDQRQARLLVIRHRRDPDRPARPAVRLHWQLWYEPTEDILAPKGTIVACTAHFDNSPNNPFNPDPKLLRAEKQPARTGE